ncbi:outer membrane protein assembly factor BamA [Roseovarius aestuarii]|uniref:Outer membrane protein assembly factor BamA n=1 Tax=Roseovarius aestuarii TaxID=475083 RepID=A0A1X7BPN8_9RHOB|nr:outer membrane protein assembly factor BamA [Roseovarius aestuarii]SMC11596.1 Outer membrane protein assembly factor BamA precursor [Roseovarius aestuarii]
MTIVKNRLGFNRTGTGAVTDHFRALLLVLTTLITLAASGAVTAQNFRFNSINVEGNQRIETATILTFADIAPGQSVSAAQVNDAYQSILASGFFESVEVEPRGSTLLIKVVEFPTINNIAFEGNKKLKDEDLAGFIESRSRQVFSPTKAERDAAVIADAYVQNGRSAARVTPRVIRRSDNRVDLVFEIFEGKAIEVQRIGFVGNRAYSDRRLRRVIDSKQAGLLRAIIARDSFVEDRLEFDKQVLRDFYQSRGYVDFRVTGTNAELARARDAYFVTFNVQEGQQFKFGKITTISEMDGVEPEEFQNVLKVRPGKVYSPTLVENSIARMERLAIKKGIDFLRVDPRITRNDRDLTLDVEFALTKGPRVFVERIDIEGNTTTLDRVIRRQFDAVEGDPFNPRQIREAAERIRALRFFSTADVNAREGSRPDQVVVDVDVEETTTGSLSFGVTFSSSGGLGASVSLRERNFLGRGQTLGFSFAGREDNLNYSINFEEPAFLGRDVAFGIDFSLIETDSDFSLFDTINGVFRPSLTFPISENGRFEVFYNAEYKEMNDYTGVSSILAAEVAQEDTFASALGYTFSYDTRRSGLNPNAGVLLSFGQEFGGLGGDRDYIETTARAIAQTKVLNEEVTLRATLEGGAVNYIGSQESRYVDRYTHQVIRGFEPNGIGPTESGEQLGGNFFAALKFEAEFPIGTPEEFGLSAGVFYDIGSIWDVDTSNATGPLASTGFEARHVIGFSLFWASPFGPLRLNFSQALKSEAEDEEQQFDITVRTDF